MRRSLFPAALAAIAAAAPAAAEFRLTVLHTNDFHSRIEPINKYDSTCSATDDAEGACFGGSARLKTMADQRRAALGSEGRAVLLLDAGDQFQGSLFYTTYKGEAAAEMMGLIGYDAMAVGNHEFDNGPDTLGAFIDRVGLPVISGNTYVADEPALAGQLPGYVILGVGGERVAVVSVVAADTGELSASGPNVAFSDPVRWLQSIVPEIESNGVDKIIALTHVGLPGDVRIANSVPGIDLIVGGHSHTLLSNTAEGATGPYPVMADNPSGGQTPIVQAYAYGKYLGEVEVVFDDAGNVVSAQGEPILLDASVTPDPQIAERIAALGQPIEALKNEVIGRSLGPIDGDRASCRSGECAMGVLVTDAMLAASDADIAIQNGGGLRASIDAGPVTMGEVLTVLPFQNTLATFDLSGAGVLAALENGLSQIEEGAGRFPQVGGMRYAFDPARPAGERLISAELRLEGGGWAPIEPDVTYKLVSNNFMRAGGDGYASFRDEGANAYDYGPGLEQVVADYIAANSPYNPRTEGRVVMVVEEDQAAMTPAETTAATAAVGDSEGIYVVQAGDSLWSIARSELGEGRRWTDLAEANGLSAPFRLDIGQELRLP